MADPSNTDGRKANEAEAPGDYTALGGKDSVKKTGEASQKHAGPDGGDAKAVGDTFKDSGKR